jgi:outer membrane protein assembly factor BamB
MQSLFRHPAAMPLLLIICMAAALAAMGCWLRQRPAVEVGLRLPGKDGRPENFESGERAINLEGTFERFHENPEAGGGSWPRFRGSDYDNIYRPAVPLMETWSEDGPEMLWQVDMLGEGHAAPVIFQGRVYLLDYDEEKRADTIRCFALEDGREIWRRWYGVQVKRNHGMSRTIPAVTEKYLVTMGPRCHVVCLDPASGDFRWGIDLTAEYGTEEPLWYTGQCPLIDEDAAVIAPAGPDVLMLGVDCESGEILWKTPNPMGWKMSHSSVLPMAVAGTRMYVYCALGGLAGVSAEAENRGELLWTAPWNARVIAPSPVPLEGNRIFQTAGYGSGSIMLRIHEENGGFRAEEQLRAGPDEWLACEQQTPVYYGGLLYGIMPKDAGALRQQFVCYDPDDGLVWSSGPENRFGLGPFLLAEDRFYILSDEGALTLAAAAADGWREKDHAELFDGHDAWGPLAPIGGRMLLRDSMRLFCIRIGNGENGN